LALVEEETRRQLAVGSEEQGFTFRTSFDPFNMIMQQLGKLDDKLGKLDEKIDTKIDGLRREMDAKINKLDAKIDARVDGLHQELHNTTRWIIGTIVAVAGVAVALASWLVR
jgi:archaellum component FlaC